MTTILRTPDAWPHPLLGTGSALAPAPAAAPADALDLEAAIAGGAFDGLRRSIRDLGPSLTIATLAEAGLRGRGGAGYPAADKWRAVSAQPDRTRYVVANGYEADPAVGTNRHLMATRPFAVLEGVLIAALTIGAEEAIIAVRAENGDAIRALEAAIAAAEAAGLAGPNVLETGHRVMVRVQPLRGGHLVGEETVLLRALEGRRAMPEQRPPYPTEKGLFDHPTLVHNVATLACVPWIVVNGADAFRAIGDPDEPGTVLVQVSGAVANPGIVEVPTGTTISAIVRLAGGVETGPAKAYLVGGPSGGLLPVERSLTHYTFAALREAGARVGSGSIVVADEGTCLVDLVRLLVRYSADEACGKSIPCRIGLRRVSEVGERITAGRARPADGELLADLAADVAASALCDHERLAAGVVATLLRYFHSEVDDHLLRGTCPAGVCMLRPAAGAGSPRGR
jgi:NADH-quinone oxidoreductase subunit F